MVFLIFPIHLFENIDLIIYSNEKEIILIEDPIYFADWERKLIFNKKKLLFHRATMKMYFDFLKTHKLIKKHKIGIQYLEWNKCNTKPKWTKQIKNMKNIVCYDPVDHLLEERLENILSIQKNEITYLETPQFLTTREELEDFYNKQTKKGLKRIYNQTAFYGWQRDRLDILMRDGKPEGGKLTYDIFNRKSIPKGLEIPELPEYPKTKYLEEAEDYIEKRWSKNYGNYDNFLFPVTFDDARDWFIVFLRERFYKFGEYQDAILEDADPILFHSGISAMLNVGLLEPRWIISKCFEFWKEKKVGLESLEGFIRQVIGWREFCRFVYLFGYDKMISSNFFKANKKIDNRWYKGTFDILPLDVTIKKAFDTAYLHHIERLMIMTNFMCLFGLKPDDGYRWFMEFAIDSYDWVMVYNVYSMGLYADGGMTTSKPYISSSNYLLKMSDYKKGEWSKKWDAFYWTFIGKHRDVISKMGRLAFQVNFYNKKSDKEKKEMEKIVKEIIE